MTRLYLLRHGNAVKQADDASRPLSERGRQDVALVAHAAQRAGVRVARLLHSDKLRARQTAEIVAGILRPRPVLEQVEGLHPEDEPEEAARLARRAREPLMLVGHLPHLGRLVSALTLGDADREVVDLATSALVALSGEDVDWRVEWLLTPEVAGHDSPARPQ